MPKKINQHVMKAEFREGLGKAYADELKAAGLEDVEIARVHIIGSVTVNVSDAQLDDLRTIFGDNLLELSNHRNSGEIEIHLPVGQKFLEVNRPTLTAEERKAQKSSGGSSFDREAAHARKAAREALRKQLEDLHGIDLDAENPDLNQD